MEELVAAIRAAIDDSELAATQCVEKNWRVAGANSCQVYVRREDYSTRTIAWCGNGHEDDFSNVIHIAHNDPASVLRRVARDRKLLERHQPRSMRLPGDSQSRQRCCYCRTDGPYLADIDVTGAVRASYDRLSVPAPWPCEDIQDLAEGYGIEVPAVAQ